MPNNAFDFENVKLQDIIDTDFLQEFQDNFGESMEIASITVDMDGIPITKPTKYTNFCSKYTQSTDEGFKRCAQSHKIGGEEASKVTSLAESKVKAAANILFTVVNALSQIGHQQLKIKNMTNILSENFSQISAAMEELAASSVQVTENQESLNKELSSVDNLSKEINNILSYIKGIADQTKMLGLNAAIEAARAGDAGRGFGVVATEIRKLSENSKKTAVKISALTEKIQNSVRVTLDAADATLNTTQQQSAAIQETNASVEEVMSLSDELNELANK